jgi:hypothetical protein
VDEMKREYLRALKDKLTTQPRVDLFDWLNRKGLRGDDAILSDDEMKEFREKYQPLLPPPTFFYNDRS